MEQQPVAHIKVTKIHAALASEEDDQLAVEQPLEINLEYTAPGGRMQQRISITMRTPGNDEDLASGFLFTEGITRQANEVLDIIVLPGDANRVLVRLREDAAPSLPASTKSFVTTSACGVCGKESIDSIRT